MHAVVVEQVGGPEALHYKEIPKPTPRSGEALIKIGAAGVNFIDVYYRTGLYKKDTPFTVGQEGAGAIEAFGEGTGSETQGFKVGDRVVFAFLAGAYAEYAAVPIDKLIPVPDGVSYADACVAMVQGMTAHYLSHDTYPIKDGDTVLVHAAAGGVGQLLVQMAKMRGGRVIGTVGSDEKAKLARADGADETIDYTKQDFEAEVKRLTGGKGVPVVYDGVGKTTFEKGLNCLRPRGYMVLYGASSGPVPPFDLSVLAAKGSLYVTRPTLVSYTQTREELLSRAGAVLEMIKSKKLRIRHGGDYKLQDAQRAHEDLHARKTMGKLILLP
ncbi:MAG TPA: quinone oxidoreductase [Candidatus Acidoferrales bacterium]|nr:quinone oxidoreductase [Candidatus Acidoferrales bacterium]